MFGSFRLFLACSVVLAHLSGSPIFHYCGIYAVFGFYVVSGYLITRVLHQTYHFEAKRFWPNRLLRLFPSYLLVAAVSLSIVLWDPQRAAGYHDALVVKHRWIDVLGNILIFPFVLYDQSFRLVPPSWSIGVELACYFLLWIFVARGVRRAAAMAVASAAYAAAMLATGEGLTPRFFPVRAAMLPFSLGALIFFAWKSDRMEIRQWVASAAGLMGLIGVLLNMAFANLHPEIGPTVCFYLNLAFMTLAVFGLSGISTRGAFLSFDRWLGDLSYPVFLLHWIVGFVVSILWLKGKPRGLDLVVLSVPFILLGASILVLAVDRPINKTLRFRIRRGKPGGATSSRSEALR